MLVVLVNNSPRILLMCKCNEETVIKTEVSVPVKTRMNNMLVPKLHVDEIP